ncbi:hypothetical protein WKI68_03810 [Streptomyces sp. MS1.HAVA.3]|uniref:Uncharacterized protein n=1 Tax=Streptomyces caledonius TaxID=3134107 RepID=A0ABU8TYX4_9ACTN
MVSARARSYASCAAGASQRLAVTPTSRSCGPTPRRALQSERGGGSKANPESTPRTMAEAGSPQPRSWSTLTSSRASTSGERPRARATSRRWAAAGNGP